MAGQRQRLVVFGKGGIGKSTICSNLAVAYAQEGLKVLLVGCDPKHDTTLYLTGGKHIPTVLQSASFQGGSPAREGLVFPGALGVDCVEAGGPEPGIGCAGRGITRMSELLKAAGVSDDSRYDVILYDVLGDVVCGGFAAPLREGFAEKVVIVTSEELMSLYAANNIARAVRNNAGRGNSLIGLVANLRDPGADVALVERFAALLGTKVIQAIERDNVVREAEFQKMTAAEFAPGSAIASAYRALARRLLEMPAEPGFVPTPLDDETFHESSRVKFKSAPAPKITAAASASPRYAPLTEPWRRFLLPLGIKPGGPPRGWESDASAAELAAERLAALHKKAGFSEASPRQDSVNLIGLPEGRGAQECARLLETVGLTVNAVLLPRLDAAEAERFLSAERHVVAARPCLEAAYRRGLAPLALAETRLPPPFGWSGTRDWFFAVAALHGRGDQARAAWAQWEKTNLPTWREERKRIAGRRAAFVTEAGEASGLIDGSNPSGVPFIPLLLEMGFSVDILLYAPAGSTPKDPGPAKGTRVTTFSTPEQLDRALREGAFDSVYSDFPLDERIARAGKSQLSLHGFEPGPQGALRTIKRLASAKKKTGSRPG